MNGYAILVFRSSSGDRPSYLTWDGRLTCHPGRAMVISDQARAEYVCLNLKPPLLPDNVFMTAVAKFLSCVQTNVNTDDLKELVRDRLS